MKTRNGFVSNSSSSSFVIITTQEKWDEAKKKFTEQVGKNVAAIVIDEYGRPEKVKVLGQDALIFSGIISSEEYGCNALDRLEIEDDDCSLSQEAYEKMSDFDKILMEDGVSYVSGNAC